MSIASRPLLLAATIGLLAATVSSPTAALISSRAAAADEWPPLPAFKYSVIDAEALTPLYHFAAAHPEIVQYVPCFCGCESKDHKAVEDCFISERSSTGTVTWNEHGAGCGVCVNVLKDARDLFEKGTPLQEIRRIVDERYYKSFRTPTPVPPQRGLRDDADTTARAHEYVCHKG